MAQKLADEHDVRGEQVLSEVDVGGVDSYSSAVHCVRLAHRLSEEDDSAVETYSRAVQTRAVAQSRSEVALGGTRSN